MSPVESPKADDDQKEAQEGAALSSFNA